MTDEETVEFDKLVRDHIPELIRESGDHPEVHVADDSEYRRRLGEKLVEEATEFHESGDTDELADVLAVVGAICRADDVERAELEERGREKTRERGGFEERVVLERVRKR